MSLFTPLHRAFFGYHVKLEVRVRTLIVAYTATSNTLCLTVTPNARDQNLVKIGAHHKKWATKGRFWAAPSGLPKHLIEGALLVCTSKQSV